MKLNKLLVALCDTIRSDENCELLKKERDYRPLRRAINKLIFFVRNEIKDFRVNYLIEYPIEEIMVLCFFAITSGCDTFNEIATYGKMNINFLKRFLPYKNNTPSHDTIRRFFIFIDNNQFENTLVKYAEFALKKARKYYENKEIIAHKIIDGKHLRGSSRFDKGDDKIPDIATLNVFDAGSEITILSLKYNYQEKETCELNAARTALNLLSLKNTVVSLDALHLHRDIISIIKSKKGHSLIGLKNNQPNLYDAVKLYFQNEIQNIIKERKNINKFFFHKEDSEKANGQIVKREIFGFKTNKYFKGDGWEDINSIFLVRKRILNHKTNEVKTEDHYYVTTLNITEGELVKDVIRNHWRIENNLHWHLDVGYLEDDSTISDRNAAVNFSSFRKLSLVFSKLIQSCLADTPSSKPSVKTSRKALGWNPDEVFSKVFTALSHDQIMKKLANWNEKK